MASTPAVARQAEHVTPSHLLHCKKSAGFDYVKLSALL